MACLIDTMPLLAKILFFSAVVGCAAGCTSGAATGESAPDSVQTDESAADVSLDAQSVAISVEAHPATSLGAIVSVVTEAPTELTVVFSSPDTRERSVVSAEASAAHQFEIVGLRADTEYQFAAHIDGGASSEAATFTTGALPQNAPTIDVVEALSSPSDSDGITFFGAPAARGEEADGPVYFGVDSEGFIVWYLNDDGARANQDPFIRNLDGEILAVLSDSVERLTLGGEVLETRDLSAVSQWHHDAILLPSGNTLALGRSVQDVDGVEVQGDVITEVDSDGAVIWEWSTFDHLDLDRYPGPLSLREGLASGAVDWTHANSLSFDEGTNQILMSVRSQNWVVAVDHTTSEISWIAGDATGASAEFADLFLELETGTWTSGQHAATLTSDGELLVYDNRNETGGESDNSRIVVYEIDTDARTATQTFEFVTPKYTSSLGDVDELPNGNMLITAGGPGSSNDAHLIEVTRTGETIWEATMPGRIYRSERITWAEIDGAATVSNTTRPVDETSEPIEEAQPQIGDAIDITDVELVSTEASCASYVGEYTSMVTDVQTGTDFEGQLEVTTDDGQCTLQSNQIPNHDMGADARFANEVGEVSSAWVIPSEPQLNAESTDLGFTVHAVMLNGVIWEAYPAACYGEGPPNLGREAIGCGGNQLDNPWRYNVGSSLNTFQLDAYSAHAQANGLYHYHSTPEALHTIECSGVAESPVIGFARDGFPIYGPCFTDADGTIRAAQSSFGLRDGTRQDVDGFTTPTVVGNVSSDEYNGQFIGDFAFVDGAGDLDECNGMTVDGRYGYYITDQYPYVLSCYSGTPSTSFGAAGGQGQN